MIIGHDVLAEHAAILHNRNRHSSARAFLLSPEQAKVFANGSNQMVRDLLFNGAGDALAVAATSLLQLPDSLPTPQQ